MKIKELKSEVGIVFLDMDGVICWLDKFVASYHNLTIPESGALYDSPDFKQKHWQDVLKNANIYELFANLGWTTHGKELVSFILTNNIPCKILTRPTAEPTTDACIKGKLEWLKKNHIHINPIFEKKKEKYAVIDGKRNILIDDHSGNIDLWNKAGGIGIHYRSNLFNDVIQKLKELYEIK